MKIVVISDASQGAGCAIAKNFQSQGWCVINVSKELSSLNKIVNIQCDFSKPMTRPVLNIFKKYLKKASRLFFVLNSSVMFDGQQEDNVKQLCSEPLLGCIELIYRGEQSLEMGSLEESGIEPRLKGVRLMK